MSDISLKQLMTNRHDLSLVHRVRLMQFILPPVLALWVVVYQLLFAQGLERAYGPVVHYGVEIAFYSLAGPLATWLTLLWVERRLVESEELKRQVEAAEKAKAAVVDEERERMARDLHDGVAQTLYFVALKADLLRQHALLKNNDDVLAELKEMGHKVRQVIREIRRTIFALRPLDWARGGFLPALRQFVDDFTDQAGWEASVAIDPALTGLPMRLEPIIFRLVQESLNNVAKHAEAGRVWLSLSPAIDEDSVHLTVRDDGRGFEPAAAAGQGLGLAQMRARVRGAGGHFSISSGREGVHGTTVTVLLPIQEAGRA